MLDDNNRMSVGNQCVESSEQTADVVEMESRSRLVEDEHNLLLVVILSKERCEFYALALATRQRRRGLAQADIAQAHVLQRLQALDNATAG